MIETPGEIPLRALFLYHSMASMEKKSHHFLYKGTFVFSYPSFAMQLQHSLTRIYLAAAVLVTVGAQTSGPIIDLGYAQYQGAVNPATNIANFKGIRYAAAPIGRFLFRCGYNCAF
jgi:hypothetical protein